MGTLELGFTIVVPPGRLGQFTKVVQFWPRLLVVNRLPQALVLEQNLTLRQRSERVSQVPVPAGSGQPFHLPQTGGERELRVKVEGGWKLSASFPVDSVGEYTLRLTRQVDVSKLKHISTRRSSEYDVVIPQMEDVGIWLETDWYRKQAVIKEIKKDSYAFTSTDIHVGDALIAINNVSVQGVPFNSIMQSMKKSLREDPCIVLRFRTMEER
ncbi:unnamed protein product, partial [Ectocarpus sp. 12 AP-2014]